MVSPGDCLKIETFQDEDGNPVFHLFVIILDPKEHNGKTIIVNFSTIRGGDKYDKTTVVYPGDDTHEFIKKNSYIAYRHADVVTIKKI